MTVLDCLALAAMAIRPAVAIAIAGLAAALAILGRVEAAGFTLIDRFLIGTGFVTGKAVADQLLDIAQELAFLAVAKRDGRAAHSSRHG